MSTPTGPALPAGGSAPTSPIDPDGDAVGSDDLGLATDISDDAADGDAGDAGADMDADADNVDVATTSGATADDTPPGGSPS